MGTTLRQMPVFIPVSCYIIGIVVGSYLSFATWLYLAYACILLIALIGYTSNQPVFIVSLMCLFVAFGMHAEHFYRQCIQCPICELHNNKDVNIKAIISSEITISADGKVNRFTIDTGKHRKIRLQASTIDSAANRLLIGDQINITGKLQTIQAPKSPRQFDYKRFMENKGIQYQIKIKEIQYLPNYRISLFRIIQQIKSVCKRKIKAHITNEYAQQVCLAMALGEKKALNHDIIQTFRQTGTAHYMAVSGLHVDLVSLILLSFFRYLNIKKTGWRIVKFLCFAAFIWFYACLVGLSPSVMRAAFMFSIYSFGSIFHLPTNHWNTLSLTAGILLIYQPSFLYDVGFQLSFIAVISIVVYYPFIANYFRSSPWLLNKCMSAIVVTLSVQVLIFPLNLYYFHQFPLNFIIANSFLWLFAILFIYGSFFLIAISFISGSFANFVGELIGYTSSTLEVSLQYIQQFDSLILTDIWLTEAELVSLYLAIISGTWFMFQSKKLAFICFFVTLTLNAELYFIKRQQSLSTAFIYVYPTYGEFRIDFIYKSSCYTFSESDTALTSAIQNNRSYHSINQIHQLKIDECYEDDKLWKVENAFEFFGHTVLVQKELPIKNACQYDFIIDLHLSEITSCHETIYIHNNTKTQSIRNAHHLRSQGSFMHEIDI